LQGDQLLVQRQQVIDSTYEILNQLTTGIEIHGKNLLLKFTFNHNNHCYIYPATPKKADQKIEASPKKADHEEIVPATP
jgi:hypothetical protein